MSLSFRERAFLVALRVGIGRDGNGGPAYRAAECVAEAQRLAEVACAAWGHEEALVQLLIDASVMRACVRCGVPSSALFVSEDETE